MDRATLKTLIKAVGIKQWQLAEAMGIREEVLSRKLRHGLDNQEEKEVLIAINTITRGREKSNATSKTES